MLKCAQCGTINEPKNKFCFECGVELTPEVEEMVVQATNNLYGKEVEVLFYSEPLSEKISGFVSPTNEQKMRYRKDGVVQNVIIESPHAADDTFAAVLAFIRQSKDYLGEEFHEAHYLTFDLKALKKEYLKLFERVMRMKEKRMDGVKPSTDPKAEKK
jgi:hypothetical protein